jgi:integrase
MTRSATPTAPSAADLLDRVEAWHDLTASARRRFVTAVRHCCRLQGKLETPELARMAPAEVLARLDRASPAEFGVAASTLRNIRAALRSLFRRAGLLEPARRREVVESSAWQPLVEALPARFHPYRLRALVAWCGAEGIEPHAVDDDVLERYLAHRQATRGGKNVRSEVAEAARQWNKARASVPGWPAVELSLRPLEGRFKTLPFAAYPSSLQEEVRAFEAWAGAPAGEDLLATGAAEPLSAATITSRLKGLRLLLGALVETGTEPDAITSLRLLTDVATVARALEFHRRRTGAKRSGYLGFLADGVQTVMAFRGVEGAQRARLRELLAKVRPPMQREVTAKVASMLEALSPAPVRARLLALPAKLMAEARRLRTGWTTARGEHRAPDLLRAAWTAATAAAIEISLNLPLRVTDLASLRIGHELQLRETSRGRWSARLRVETRKTSKIVETELGADSVRLLREYLDAFRPLAPHAGSSWLFPSRDHADRPRTAHHFSEAIGAAVHRHCGVRVTVHGFRSFVACLILEDDPHAWTDVQAVLGHAGLMTAQKHYARINRLAAGERLSDGLARRRRSLGRAPLPTLAATGPRRGGPRRSAL